MLGDKVQHADWKKEKHAPVIDCPSEVKAGELFEVTVGLGKEIAHPNTTDLNFVQNSLQIIKMGT